MLQIRNNYDDLVGTMQGKKDWLLIIVGEVLLLLLANETLNTS